uniref:TRAP-like protein 1 n=1 Tax=Plasmodium berghei TaxID=5821 RepID=A0ASC7_PLABE|nr:TRAP-like protein 1 [Plasmodium berghei]
MKYTNWWIIYYIIYFLLLNYFCENKSLIDRVTTKGDLDIVLLLDTGNDKNGDKNNSERFRGILNNIIELSNKLLVKNENRNVKISFITYGNLYVQTKGIVTNNQHNNEFGDKGVNIPNELIQSGSIGNTNMFSVHANTVFKNPTLNLEQFIKVVLKTKIDESNDNIIESNHLKALNYVGLKHFYNSNINTTKLIIMFINTDGNKIGEKTDLDIINNLFDKKKITLNIITKIQYLSYCHYINNLGPNTNELLRCIAKNSYYNNHILTNILIKLYKDIPVDAICNDWDDWTACTTTCDIGFSYRQRTMLTNIKNPINGFYKRKGKNCSQKNNFIMNECFYKSCDNSLDICDQEMDISLLVDDSSIVYSQSIWLKYFITPIRKMISQFNISNNLVNISISSFSNQVYNWFDFSSPLSSNRNKLLTFLTNWRYNLGGSTKDIISALNFINNNVLNSNKNRQNVKKILIIINTGDIHDNNYNEIIKKISHNYNLDIYSICLKNKNLQNCSALSIDSNYILGNNKKKFFYSFEEMGGFNDNINLIQKNICFNSSYNQNDISKKKEIPLEENKVKKVDKMNENKHDSIKSKYIPFKENIINKKLKNNVILKSVNNLDEINNDDQLDIPLKKYKSDSFISNAGKNDNNKNPIHSVIKRLLNILCRQKKKYSIQKINSKDKNKLTSFIKNLKHYLSNNNDNESNPNMFEKVESDFNNLLVELFHKSPNSTNNDLNDKIESCSGSTHNINYQPTLNDDSISSYSHLFDNIDTDPYWNSEINLQSKSHLIDNDELDKMNKSENLIVPSISNPINNFTDNNIHINPEFPDDPKKEPVNSEILESGESEDIDKNILPSPKKSKYGIKKNKKNISKYDIINKFRNKEIMKIDFVSLDLNKDNEIEKLEKNNKNVDDKKDIDYKPNISNSTNTNYEQKIPEKIISLEDIAKMNNQFIENENRIIENKEISLSELKNKDDDWKTKHLEWEIDMSTVHRNNKGIESYIDHNNNNGDDQKKHYHYVYKYAASFFVATFLLLGASAFYAIHKNKQIIPTSVIPEEFMISESQKTENYKDQNIVIDYNDNSPWK